MVELNQSLGMTTIERKYKTEVQRSEFGFERRGKGVSAVFGIRRSLAPETEPNGLCPDEGVWDAFFWQVQKKAPQEVSNPRGLHHLSPGGKPVSASYLQIRRFTV